MKYNLREVDLISHLRIVLVKLVLKLILNLIFFLNEIKCTVREQAF